MATNNLSAQKVVLDLLRYVGITGFTAVANEQSLNQPGIDDDDVNRALAAVNSALQTIQKHGPQDLKFARRSAYFRTPESIANIGVTNGLRAATSGVALSSWMVGCSVMLTGDSELNRIMSITGTAVTLLRAYLGTTGVVGGTVYADCALLDNDVSTVLEPVLGTGNLILRKAPDIDEFERLRTRCWCHAGTNYVGTLASITTAIGTPCLWMVERQLGGIPFLRVSPMPPTAFVATYQAKLRAERITATVLDQTGATDPNYYFQSLHDDEVESLLLPIARWRFFTHPALKNSESRGSVKADYDEVYATLKAGTIFESSEGTTRATFI